MKNNRLVAFVYAALKTLPTVQVEALIDRAEQAKPEFKRADYDDPHLALKAKQLADRLTKREATEKQKVHLKKARGET